MTECSSCGAALAAGQRFCRACGAKSAGESAHVPSSSGDQCVKCHQPIAPGAKFCRQCGESVDAYSPAAPGVTVRSSRRRSSGTAWLVAAGVVAACLIAAAGAYFAWPLLRPRPGPDDGIVRAALAQQLPPFARLQTLTVDSVRRDTSSNPPIFNIQFTGSAVLASSVYQQARVEDDVIFLTEQGASGSPIPLAGTAQFHQDGGQWQYGLSLTPHPLLTAVSREAFGTRQTIVVGSAEEHAYQQAQVQARDDAQRQAEAEAARVELRQRAEQARRIAERQQAEAERIEAARAAQERQAQALLAERAKIEAERQAQAQAARDAKARNDRQEEELRRQQAQRAPSPDSTTRPGGRIPKGAEVTVRLASGLRTDAVKVEDRFTATTIDDIVVEGQVLAPAGSTVRGIVASVQPATRTKRKAQLDLRFDLLTVGSQSVPVRARATRVLTGPGLKGDAKKVAIGSAAGAILGAILGGGKGAAVGVAVGGGGTLAATEGQEIDLPAGSTIRIAFDSPVDLQ